MTLLHLSPRWTRTAAVSIVALALGAGTLTASAAADQGNQAVPAPPAAPTSADQIQNIDQVRTAIKGYYGDTVTTTLDPVNGTTALHTFNPDGNYAHELDTLTVQVEKYLKKAKQGYPVPPSAKRAILLDVDDTSLNTYNYEIYSNFVYNPTSNAAFVNSASFPAVPHMPELVDYAISKKYTVFFLTGRPETQRAGTVTNLANAGFPSVPSDQLFLKDLTKPIYSSCYQPPTSTCSTIQYKSLTRKYIESQGYDIVANLGDQYSDLLGGYANRTFKVPNPMYYLP